MGNYEATWVGLDVGREGLWTLDKWLGVLQIVAAHEGEAVYDADSPVYRALSARFPDDKWMSDDAGRARPLFRDYPEAWNRTGVLDIADGTFHVTRLGREVVEGRVLQAAVIERAIAAHSEEQPSGTEYPLRIVAMALLEAPEPLDVHDLYHGVMRRYRPGVDDLQAEIAAGRGDQTPIPQTRRRRLRAMMRLLEDAGAAVRIAGDGWTVGDEEVLRRIATGAAPADPARPPPRRRVAPARPARGAGRVGGRYREAPEDEVGGAAAPILVDPDVAGAGRLEHNRTQNAFAEWLRGRGAEPRSFVEGEPRFDLTWSEVDRVFVVEVKSIGPANETQQVRLGIGQVLDYRHRLQLGGIEVVPVVVLSRRPRDGYWAELCASLGIRLYWREAGDIHPPE